MHEGFQIGGWTIDKRASLGTLWMIIGQLVFIVWFMSAQSSSIEHNQQQQSLINRQVSERLDSQERLISELTSTLNAELRLIQQDRNETNGRLIRIETLLTQNLDRLESIMRSSNGQNPSLRAQ